MCGVLSGAIATWNLELDAAYAFRTLLAPGSSLQLTHISDPMANLQVALDAFNEASTTAAGGARLAPVAALIELPRWVGPRHPEPAPSRLAPPAGARAQWETPVPITFSTR